MKKQHRLHIWSFLPKPVILRRDRIGWAFLEKGVFVRNVIAEIRDRL